MLHNHTLMAGVSYDHYEKPENNATSGNTGHLRVHGDGDRQHLYRCGICCVTPPNDSTGTSTGQTAPLSEDQSFANFLTGNANNGFSQASTNNRIDVNMNVYEFYVQDNWKVSPRLTLNLGVRYA